MSLNETAFVFSCARLGVFGISRKSGGNDLPEVGPDLPWSFKAIVGLTERDLAPYAWDTNIARANLETRGYHIAHKDPTRYVREFAD